jgi:hypothetical protein
MHVYSPGVQGYIPIEWKLEAGTLAKLHAFEYPPSHQLRLKAINETVQVYLGYLRINREITFGPENALKPWSVPGELILKGSLQYQACDDKKCFIPQTVPAGMALPF